MALEGSLKEFGLADILQLLYFQRKTGVLTIEGRADRVRVGFYEGNITFAESKRSDFENRLGKILLRKGVITEERLNASLDEQKTSGTKLGAILKRNGYATAEQIQEVVSSQITETVVQLFSWKEGKYEFQPKGIPMDKDVPISVDTQHLLMEGLRILDEWSLVEGKITLDTVFLKREADEETLTPEEKEILSLVDGESDVSTISMMSGMDNFQVSKTMLSLLDKGLLSKRQPPAKEEEEAPPAPLKIPISRRLPEAVLAGGVIFSLIVMLVMGSAALEFFSTSEEIYSLRFKIELEKYRAGSYPKALSGELAKKDSWGNPYLYSPAEEDFVLKSTGPDGIPGTPDDIY